jgi:hypothetical protein
VLSTVKQDLAHYYQLLHEKSKAGKQLKMDNFLKISWPADPPNTSSDILPSTSMAISAKHNTADFFDQLNPLLYHRNYLLHQHLQWIMMTLQWLSLLNHLPIQHNDSSIRSPTHSFSKSSTMRSVSANFDFDSVVQLFCTRFKEIMPSKFLAVSCILFQTK